MRFFHLENFLEENKLKINNFAVKFKFANSDKKKIVVCENLEK